MGAALVGWALVAILSLKSVTSQAAGACRAPASGDLDPTGASCESIRTAYGTSNDLLILGGTVLSMVPGEKVTADAAIVVEGGVIKHVGDLSTAGEGFDLQALNESLPVLKLDSEDIILPGLINAHTHAAMSLFKNLGSELALAEWLNDAMFPLEREFVNAEFCVAGVKLAMAEFLRGGTTTFADMYLFQDTVAAEVEKVGMRAYLGQGIIDFPLPDNPTPNDTLAYGEAYIKNWVGSKYVVPFLTPHAPYTTSRWVYEAAARLNREYGVPTWTHCLETQEENSAFRLHQGLAADSEVSEIEWLDDIGLLADDLTCVHSVWLSEADILRFGQTGAKAVHCPSSNMKLASGLMDYVGMRQQNVTIGIGTDGHASNNDVDLLEEARLASFLHKGKALDPKVLPALDALRHLTVEGAKVLRRESDLGTIEVGKRADLAILRGKGSVKFSPRFEDPETGTRAAQDLASLVVYSANALDVRGTVVDGKVLFLDGCYTTLDVAEVLRDARRWGEKIKKFVHAKHEPRNSEHSRVS